MEEAAVVAGRVWFENKLREKAGAKSITIDDVIWSDNPEANDDVSYLEVRSGYMKVKHRIPNMELLYDKPDRSLEQLIDAIVDSLIADS